MQLATWQLLTAILWFGVALITTPGTKRQFFSKAPRVGDPSKSAFFFTALIFVGGNVRWLIAPDDMLTWKMIYALSIALAVYVAITIWNFRRDK